MGNHDIGHSALQFGTGRDVFLIMGSAIATASVGVLRAIRARTLIGGIP